MPLVKRIQLSEGSSKEVIEKNIAELIKAGHKPDQAAAIAYKEAGEDDHPETYLEVLQKSLEMEHEAIAIGLKLVSLCPPEDIDQLIEITNDENDHSRIYTDILRRYQAESEEGE